MVNKNQKYNTKLFNKHTLRWNIYLHALAGQSSSVIVGFLGIPMVFINIQRQCEE